MSEQPASSAPSATAAATARPARLIPGRDIDASIFREVEDVTDIRTIERTDSEPRERRAYLGLTHQEEVDVIAWQCAVERRMHGIGRPQRTHNVRRHQDDQIGSVLLVLGAAEQRAKHRHVAGPWQL